MKIQRIAMWPLARRNPAQRMAGMRVSDNVCFRFTVRRYQMQSWLSEHIQGHLT